MPNHYLPWSLVVLAFQAGGAGELGSGALQAGGAGELGLGTGTLALFFLEGASSSDLTNTRSVNHQASAYTQFTV